MRCCAIALRFCFSESESPKEGAESDGVAYSVCAIRLPDFSDLRTCGLSRLS